MKTTACPMDCFDACKVIYKDGKTKPSKDGITDGKLCKLFGYLQNENNLKDKNLDTTLQTVVKKLKEPNKKVLYYKGSGNMGVMQSITKRFFEQIDATFAVGSNCEAAGEAGIEMGRGDVVNPHIQNLLDSDIVVVWGRNFTQTSTHIYNLVKDKTFITIDPYETPIAKLSKVYLQIAPKGDYQLAQILSQLLKNSTLKIDTKILESLNITQKQLDKFITLIKGKKIAFMMGIGVQKYKQGAEIFHEIEKFANQLGIFKPNNGGVWYLSNSGYPFNSKIAITPTKTVSYPDVDFGTFDIVFIQGANPVVSAPNTKKVIDGLKKSFVIFMGTTFNDTAKYANIIIPAKTFLEKQDVRLSYGHDEVTFCDICKDTTDAISEYDFTKYLCEKFNFDILLSEDEYFDCYKTVANQKPKINFIENKTANVPLLDLKEDEYYLLTSKATNTLNSQFKYDEYAYVHPSLNLKDEQIITLSSDVGTIKIKVKNDSNLHKKSILIYAGNKQVNVLTPSTPSNYGNNAIFQDIKIKILD